MEYKKIFLCFISFKPAYIEVIKIINSWMLSIGRDGINEPLLSGKNKRNIYNKKKKCWKLICFFTTKMILMKLKLFFLEKLYLVFSIILNLLVFFITYINYSSHRGTDFGIYGNYIRYFLYSETFSLQEQTVGYFSIIAKVTNLKKDTLLVSADYENLIFNWNIKEFWKI